MVDVVNVTGSGLLAVELELNSVAKDIGTIAQCDTDRYPRVYLRFTEDASLITVYRTEKYIVTGADSVDESYDTRMRFLDLFAEIGIIEASNDE